MARGLWPMTYASWRYGLWPSCPCPSGPRPMMDHPLSLITHASCHMCNTATCAIRPPVQYGHRQYSEPMPDDPCLVSHRSCTIFHMHVHAYLHTHMHAHARSRTHVCTLTCTHAPKPRGRATANGAVYRNGINGVKFYTTSSREGSMTVGQKYGQGPMFFTFEEWLGRSL